MVQDAAEKAKNASPAVKSLLSAITKHDNVPRKKAKFMVNFYRSVYHSYKLLSDSYPIYAFGIYLIPFFSYRIL